MRKIINSTYITLDGVVEAPHRAHRERLAPGEPQRVT
jgi:hypothetical protein